MRNVLPLIFFSSLNAKSMTLKQSDCLKHQVRVFALILLCLGSLMACDRKQESPRKPARQIQSKAHPLRVGSFSMKDQNNHVVNESVFDSGPAVVAFMFTRCPTICPKLTRTMVKLRAQAEERGLPLRFISISVDPENDQPEVLKAYSAKFGADRLYPKMPEWLFLSGDHEKIAEVSEKGFRMGLSGTFDESKPHLGITHGSHFILVDQKGVIVDYYRSAEPERLAQLLTDSVKLFE